MRGGPFSFGTRILAAGAGLLALFLLVGFLLPGRWSARSVAVLDAPPSGVYPWLDGPEGWRAWTPWPDTRLERAGPARGAGARLSWDDLDLGDGVFEIVEARPDSLVRYTVAVDGGALHTRGTLRLTRAAEGTRVVWEEEGDFGWNPLMGYWALAMSRVQSREMERGLDRLGVVAAKPDPSVELR